MADSESERDGMTHSFYFSLDSEGAGSKQCPRMSVETNANCKFCRMNCCNICCEEIMTANSTGVYPQKGSQSHSYCIMCKECLTRKVARSHNTHHSRSCFLPEVVWCVSRSCDIWSCDLHKHDRCNWILLESQCVCVTPSLLMIH